MRPFGVRVPQVNASNHAVLVLRLEQPAHLCYLVGHQTGACSEAPPHPLNRMRLCYAFSATRFSFIMCKYMR
eukprot:361596-Chlamydomonas_euryale.AAC.4